MTIDRSLRLFAILGLVAALAACSTPRPPRPAMQPLAVAGDFGFSDRKIDDDTIEVIYRGAQISVNSRDARNDTRLEAEKLKVRDLALLRAARLAQERGFSQFKVVNERLDSDTDVRSRPRCHPSPFWGSYWGHPGYYGYRNYYGWPGPAYDCYESRWAKGRAIATLTIDLLPPGAAPDPAAEPVADTITRLEKTYAGVTYP
jgi:hypothetical protein